MTHESDQETSGPGDSHVADYKLILRRVLDNRPSGTRLKLAAALGKNRSFVTQITNPAYLVPIPAKHVAIIFEVCHLSGAERAAFLEAYGRAHPGKTTRAAPRSPYPQLHGDGARPRRRQEEPGARTTRD